MCLSCSHLGYWDDIVPRCDAFPGGIPGEIIWWGEEHTNAWPGDNGISYEWDGASDRPAGFTAANRG